ncbi:MAG: hypothetical protein PVJ27_08770 [Candidatus Brocadiaceae bacterium]
MSAVCVLTPAIIAGWPAITAAVSGAAAALGFSMSREAEAAVRQAMARTEEGATAVDVAVENSEVIAENVATGQEIVMARENVVVRVYRDERGQCRVSAEGPGRSREELQAVARQLVNKMTQIYVYNELMSELPGKGFTVVNEEATDREVVRIHVRRSTS